MLKQPSSEPLQHSVPHDTDQLHLNPGVPERKPRSTAKCCLLTTLAIIVLLGCSITYMFVKTLRHALLNPHSNLYYNKPASEITDWSKVIRPMITQNDTFDIIASVWVQDKEGKDGVLYIDGEERPERLIFSDTVFRDLHLGGKLEHTDVSLRVPTSHFKQVNISNYDLRASFVLVQRNQPPWLNGAKKIHSWRPEHFQEPKVRHWAEAPSFQDQIYDSFGITIPLIQFHNIASNPPTENVQAQPEDVTSYASSDESDPLVEDDDTEAVQDEKKQAKNNFVLEFAGDYPNPITEHHPYIVTRTHLGMFKDTELYDRNAYILAQKELVKKACIDPKTKTPREAPKWHQCTRTRSMLGVLQTRVQLSSHQRESPNKGRPQAKWENLYAPYLGTLVRAAGPKDLFPVPINRESSSSRPSLETSDGGFVNVTWKLSFSGHSAEAAIALWTAGLPERHNMTAPENELLFKQHEHEATRKYFSLYRFIECLILYLVGFLGYRNHENAHPRRLRVLGVLSAFALIPTWFLSIHYWYTRTSTVGISKLGNGLIASSLLFENAEELLMEILEQGAGGWPLSVTLFMLASMEMLVMLKAIFRIEFGSPVKKISSKRWFTRIYIAKATHAERASDRIEARVPMRLRLLCLSGFFAVIYYFELAYWHPVLPLMDRKRAGYDALISLHAYALASLKVLHALRFTGEMGGGILQLAMNIHSRTYGGKYKTAAALIFIGNLIQVLDMVPLVVGSSTRVNGFGLWEGSRLVLSFLNVVQAVKYHSAKSPDVDETEE